MALYRLNASASFHGRVVAETFARSGAPLELGDGATFPVPIPEGMPYLARVSWTGAGTCEVEDGRGGRHALEAGKPVELDLGQVRLTLRLVPYTGLPWFERPTVTGSFAWFALVLMMAVLGLQVAWLGSNTCLLATELLPGVADVGRPAIWVAGPTLAFAITIGALVLTTELRRVWGLLALAAAALLLPVGYTAAGVTWKSGEALFVERFAFCVPEQGEPAAGPGSNFTAEYLARLLRKDLEGDQDGNVVEDRPAERPQDLKPSDNPEHVWLPAGNQGPVTKMGGAEETSRRPVRTVTEESAIRPKRRVADSAPVAENGVRPPQADAERSVDGAADGLEVDPNDSRDASEAPSEEERGWGIPDWYDQEDAAMDHLEIEVMLRVARRRLAIDPDDPAALGLLSYYQYLAQDYKSAIRTYDRMIELWPDEAAAYNNKALVYKRLGDYRKEEGLYRQALSLDPMDETALNNLAVNLAHQKRFEEALAIMEQLEVLDPDDAYADLHRSKIHAEMGDDEKALEYLVKALDGMRKLDTLHHIEFRQDIRLDPSFAKLRETQRFRAILARYYGKDSPLEE